MIVLRKESKEGKSSDHYGGYEGLLVKGRTSFFHWGFLGLSLGALRRPYSTMHQFGEGPKEEAKSKKNIIVTRSPLIKAFPYGSLLWRRRSGALS